MAYSKKTEFASPHFVEAIRAVFSRYIEVDMRDIIEKIGFQVTAYIKAPFMPGRRQYQVSVYVSPEEIEKFKGDIVATYAEKMGEALFFELLDKASRYDAIVEAMKLGLEKKNP